MPSTINSRRGYVYKWVITQFSVCSGLVQGIDIDHIIKIQILKSNIYNRTNKKYAVIYQNSYNTMVRQCYKNSKKALTI